MFHSFPCRFARTIPKSVALNDRIYGPGENQCYLTGTLPERQSEGGIDLFEILAHCVQRPWCQLTMWVTFLVWVDSVFFLHSLPNSFMKSVLFMSENQGPFSTTWFMNPQFLRLDHSTSLITFWQWSNIAADVHCRYPCFLGLGIVSESPSSIPDSPFAWFGKATIACLLSWEKCCHYSSFMQMLKKAVFALSLAGPLVSQIGQVLSFHSSVPLL